MLLPIVKAVDPWRRFVGKPFPSGRRELPFERANKAFDLAYVVYTVVFRRKHEHAPLLAAGARGLREYEREHIVIIVRQRPGVVNKKAKPWLKLVHFKDPAQPATTRPLHRRAQRTEPADRRHPGDAVVERSSVQPHGAAEAVPNGVYFRGCDGWERPVL